MNCCVLQVSKILVDKTSYYITESSMCGYLGHNLIGEFGFAFPCSLCS